MTHDGPLGLGDRFIKQGYQPSSVAENVGFFNPSPSRLRYLDEFPEHRANILDPTYVHFGSASAQGSNGMYFWTQLFARPMDMNMDPCDFNAAAAAARLTPPVSWIQSKWYLWTRSRWSSWSNVGPYGNCVSVDNGMGGKTLLSYELSLPCCWRSKSRSKRQSILRS